MGLVNIAKKLGLNGESLDMSKYSVRDALALLEVKLTSSPVIASIHKNLNPTNSGHLVVITEIKDNMVTFYDPDVKVRNEAKITVSLDKFLIGWKKRIIVIEL